VVAIHGEGRTEPVVFLGGKDKKLGVKVHAAWRGTGTKSKPTRTQSYKDWLPPLSAPRVPRRRPFNLKLSSGLRETVFESFTAEGRKKPTDELAKFAGAVRRQPANSHVLH
jgi:phage replication-related protein YjqB (UPF0714/DUF867 family)